MNLNKVSPAILTLLVVLIMQGMGTAALLGFDFLSHVSLFAIVLMLADVLAILACWGLVHNIRFRTALDVSSVSWPHGMLALSGGIFGAIGMAVLTDSVEVPDDMLQVSVELSHNTWGILMLVVVGPIAEELLFREAIAGEMLRRGATPWAAILVSSLSFSIVHLNFAQGIYALPLGALLGIIYCKTGNVVLSALLHILNNGIVVLLMHLGDEDSAETSFAEWFGGMTIPYIIMVFSIVLCCTLMTAFWRRYTPAKTPHPAKNENLT